MPEDTPRSGAAPPDRANERTRIYLDLFAEIGMTGHLVRTLMEQRLPGGLIDRQFMMLTHLVRTGDPTTPHALAQAFRLPKTSVTHTLGTLAARGLVEIRPNPGDGRSKLVHLTAAGRTMQGQAVAALGPDIAALAAEHPPAEIAELVPRLRRIRRWLGAARPG